MPNLKRKMKPFRIYADISRVDSEERIVEGYAFVNEVVPGERGIRLTRAAMEAATANYVENGTCREIHQPKAAGKPISVTWDEKGAFLRMKVVDDQAWEKVKENVYKGFSVGVTPLVMRGNSVTDCDWWDTSLIDRGKDRDALFTLWRSAEVDPDAEVEVEVLERASFAEYLENVGPSQLRDMALDYLWNALYDIQNSYGNDGNEMTGEEKEAAVRETCAQFTEFMVGAVATGKLPNVVDPDNDGNSAEPEVPYVPSRAAMAELTRDWSPEEGLILRSRFERLEAGELPSVVFTEAPLEITRAAIVETLAATNETVVTEQAWEGAQAAITRAAELEETVSTLTRERTEAQTELARAQELERAAKERVAQLEAMPARTPPVRSYVGLERQFGTPLSDGSQKRVETLQAEKAEIMRSRGSLTNDHEREAAATRVILIDQELTRLRG